MRPRKTYTVFCAGRVIKVCEGRAEAEAEVRRMVDWGYPSSLKAFGDREAAEEFAMWWNHEHEDKALQI